MAMCYQRCIQNFKLRGGTQACRGYGYPWINLWICPWIYPCVDMRLRPCCGYIHGYYAGTPAN